MNTFKGNEIVKITRDDTYNIYKDELGTVIDIINDSSGDPQHLKIQLKDGSSTPYIDEADVQIISPPFRILTKPQLAIAKVKSAICRDAMGDSSLISYLPGSHILIQCLGISGDLRRPDRRMIMGIDPEGRILYLQKKVESFLSLRHGTYIIELESIP